ncbi:MAG: rhodanese-like domain-containing protein [Parcubacteria group bacterium]|jgi:rhodanese-related sulfurtransferase
MFNSDQGKEEKNIKAIAIGLFLIALISAITIFKSNSEKKTSFKNNQEAAVVKPTEIDPAKIGKITSTELAKKIQTNHEELILVDFRDTNSYKNEHIVDSINMPVSDIASFPQVVAKNKTCILIQKSEEMILIGDIADILSALGYTNLFYLDGGFESWKNNFNPTISDGDQNSFADQAKVRYITSDDLKRILATEKNLVIIDARKSDEFSTGHIAAATNIFLDDIEKRRKELPLNKTIIIYTDTALGAFKGAARLFDLGFSNTFALSDGLDTWKTKGYELTK